MENRGYGRDKRLCFYDDAVWHEAIVMLARSHQISISELLRHYVRGAVNAELRAANEERVSTTGAGEQG